MQFYIEQINKVNSFCLKHNTSYLEYHYTKDNSLFCQFVINYHHIYLEIFFDEKVETVEDVVMNIYENKINKLSYGGELDDSLEKINSIILV